MATVRSRRPGTIILSGIVTIEHGDNYIDDDMWNKVADSNFAKWYIEKGWIQVVEAAPSTASAATAELTAPNVPATLEDIKAREAAKLIRATSDPDVLKAWRREDTRVTVLQAIDKRLGDLFPTLEITAVEAIEMVGNVSDEDALRAWREAEERKTVRTAIEERLAQLAEAR